jgi:protein tyrosine phosphatase (PTP) superfamily phosphohydrolase (DUF442 family)
MTDPAFQSIINYRLLSTDLITGGQPSEEQLVAVAAAGFEAVINLALHDAPYSLKDEAATIEAVGMTYEHIPVVWERPERADLQRFFEAMERHRGRRVFVHCAANYRASAFIMLYRVLRLGWRIEDALPDMRAIWNPAGYPAWQAFIEVALAARSESKP